MTAILFGSISSLADTSELQREAFNAAFAEHGLDWRWDRAEYVDMLASNGGRDRVAEYAKARGEEVDADAVHASKSAHFQAAVATSGVVARPGVVDTIRAAKDSGVKVALVTTTSAANIDALAGALAEELAISELDLVVDASQVSRPKPDGEAYVYALEQLSEKAESCVAVEDNQGGVDAANAAGVAVMAFPNANTAGHDFSAAAVSRDHLELADLQSLISR